jgi:predicted Zn-dependent protease
MVRRVGSVLRFGVLAVLLAGLAACAGLESSTTSAGLVPTVAPRVVGADTPTRREHSRILAAYGGAYQDPALDLLLSEVSAKVSAASDRPDIAYRITVLNSPSINAFALPTGDLYVTRGLLALASDTSEIAAVIAHEMGHVSARHAFDRADKEREAVLVSRVVSDVLNDPEAGATSLAKSRLELARFSREQELEADRIGVRTLAKAGYDPYGASRFLAAMGRNAALRAASFGGGEGEKVDFMSSHPATPERVERATTAAKDAQATSKPERDRDRFLTAIEGMVYGDDPAQGFVRGNRFIHPVIGFVFEAPPGFNLENASESIVGIGQNETALRFDSVKVPSGQPIGQHLATDLMTGVEVSGVEEVTVNGFPAALAVARGRDWNFRLAGIRFGSDVYRIVYAARQLTPEIDAQFRASIQSFRRLTSSEGTSVRPQRLAIVKAKTGDTMQSLAARMATADRQIERFQVLNELAPEAQIVPGGRYKLIVE